MTSPHRTSHDLGIRSFGSIGKRSRVGTQAIGMRSKRRTGRIYNYPRKREASEK